MKMEKFEQKQTPNKQNTLYKSKQERDEQCVIPKKKGLVTTNNKNIIIYNIWNIYMCVSKSQRVLSIYIYIYLYI